MRSDEPTNDGDDSMFDAVLRAVAHAPPCEPVHETPPGARWGARYVIERKLGSGGMGTVYLATDSLLGRLVALKVLHPSERREADTQRERLLREARLAALVEHERVARVYDVGEHDDQMFVAMEYVRGTNLRAWMGQPHAPSEVLALVAQIADGLEVLHDASVVHRDLKPENVMLLEAGGVKLLDFGLAGQVLPVDAVADTAELGDGSTFSGTVGYIAPEGHVDARADIFAFGVILHELVTGERPFPAVRGSVLAEVLRTTPPGCDGDAWKRYPTGLSALARRTLALDRGARFADGKAVRAALRELAPPATAGRRPIWYGLAIAGLAIGADVSLRKPPRAVGPPPAGMALIDEGELAVGQTAEAVDAQCREIGAKCLAEPTDDESRAARADLRRVQGYQVPRTTVRVAPFYLDVHEVTNREMVEVLNAAGTSLDLVPDDTSHELRYVHFQTGAGPANITLLDLDAEHGGIERGPDRRYRVLPGRGDWPVVQVTWYGADFYCRAQGKRLPTEDEWEAAARGHDDRPFPWGAERPRCGGVNLPNDAYFPLPGCPETATAVDVMTSPQDVTPQGIHDLGGNAAEWTSTPFEDARRGREDARPDAPHVIRGGSYFYSFSVHTSSRNKRPANTAHLNVGLRCAADAQGA